MINVSPLTAVIGAEVTGFDARELDDAAFAAIRTAFEEHSVLVLPGQYFDDATQIAFSRRFGPLETTGSANPAAGTHFARQSNLDINSGAVILPGDRRMIYQKANQLWHSDSSFKEVPSLCSLLSARLVPPEGGNTEFASTRAAYAALPEAMKARIAGLEAEHSLTYSRDRIDPSVLTPEQKAERPPVRQPLVRTNPVNGRKSLLIGAHASHIIGMPHAAGRALLEELLAFATEPRFCYSHRWRDGDVVVWDNRAVLHRATPYDTVRYRRLMQRTTVAGEADETRRTA